MQNSWQNCSLETCKGDHASTQPLALGKGLENIIVLDIAMRFQPSLTEKEVNSGKNWQVESRNESE